jgi:hypothetical protein
LEVEVLEQRPQREVQELQERFRNRRERFRKRRERFRNCREKLGKVVVHVVDDRAGATTDSVDEIVSQRLRL